jgi:hypothetical protein
MITINIFKNNILTNQAFFETEKDADDWLNICLKTKCFGEPGTYQIKVEYN